MDAHELEAADNANAEGLWLDLVAAFGDRTPAVSSTVSLVRSLVVAEFVTLPLPAPKATVRERVARFILRRF